MSVASYLIKQNSHYYLYRKEDQKYVWKEKTRILILFSIKEKWNTKIKKNFFHFLLTNRVTFETSLNKIKNNFE